MLSSGVPVEDDTVVHIAELEFPFKITVSSTPSKVCPGTTRADTITGDVLALSIARVAEPRSCKAWELTYKMPDVDNLVDMTVLGRGPALSSDVKAPLEYSGLCFPRWWSSVALR